MGLQGWRRSTTLKSFHNSEQYNTRIVNTMSYFSNAGHRVQIMTFSNFSKRTVTLITENTQHRIRHLCSDKSKPYVEIENESPYHRVKMRIRR